MNKIILSDLDETLTRFDVLDFLIAKIGKENYLNEIYSVHKRLDRLKKRIDLLSGSNVDLIEKILKENIDIILKPNYRLFLNYIKSNRIEMIIMSGNIEPVVRYFSNIFNACHIFYTNINIDIDGKIMISSKIELGKEINIVSSYFEGRGIDKNNVLSIGNDASDIPFWKMFPNSVFFSRKNRNVSKYAKYCIGDDFKDLITLLSSM